MAEPLTDQALALHRDSIVVDGCGIDMYLSKNETVFRRWIAGGATAVALGIGVRRDDVGMIVKQFGDWYNRIRFNRDELLLAESVADIERAKREGKLAVIFSWQGAEPLGNETQKVEIFHRLGLRQVQLSYNTRNAIADGINEPEDAGISQLGRQMIREMNRVGIVVDLSHCSPRTCREAIEVSEQPCVVSHSNCAAVFDHARNISDDLIRAIHQSGGTIGMNFWSYIIAPNNTATLDDLVNHVDHIAQITGTTENIAIGTDMMDVDVTEEFMKKATVNAVWTKVPMAPVGRVQMVVPTAEHLPEFTAALLRRGYSRDAVRGILGGNLLRVWRQVWGR